TVIAGPAGTGKTVFSLQMLFAAARQRKRCLYITTLSEPAIKLLRYMQLFSFFDERLLEQQVVMRDLGGTLQAGGTQVALDELTDIVEDAQPDVVVIDSFKAMHDLIQDPALGRVAIYNA